MFFSLGGGDRGKGVGGGGQEGGGGRGVLRKKKREFVGCLTSQQHASVSQGWIC